MNVSAIGSGASSLQVSQASGQHRHRTQAAPISDVGAQVSSAAAGKAGHKVGSMLDVKV
jgi:hypothetical protein